MLIDSILSIHDALVDRRAARAAVVQGPARDHQRDGWPAHIGAAGSAAAGVGDDTAQNELQAHDDIKVYPVG